MMQATGAAGNTTIAKSVNDSRYMDKHMKVSEKDQIESYIVRIYRRREEPEVTGMVEFPERDASQPFHSFEELRGILGGDKKRRGHESIIHTKRSAGKGMDDEI